jgi:hypothetical protein
MTEMLPVIPRGLLAYLLDQVGPAGPLSPRHLMGDPVAPNRRQRVELAVGGYTSSADDPSPLASFVPVASRMLEPTTVIDLRVWQGLDAAWSHIVFDGIDGLTVTEAGTGVVITGGVGPTDVADLVVPLIGAAERQDIEPGVELEVHIDAASAAAFSPVLAATREAARRGAPAGGLPIATVLDHAVAPIDSMPAASLRLQSRIMSRASGIPDRDEVGLGLRRLADSGMIRMDQRSVTASAPVEGIARLLPTHVAGYRWQRRTMHDGDVASTTDRIVNIGEAGLLFEVGLGAEGHVAWRTISAETARRCLATELAILSYRSAQPR